MTFLKPRRGDMIVEIIVTIFYQKPRRGEMIVKVT